MPAPRATFITDILEEHLEELAFLWGQRRSALRSPRYTRRAVGDLEERIDAHLQGILTVGEPAIPLLESTLLDGDDLDAFAASYALLSMRAPALTAKVLDAFRTAEGATLNGIREALCHVPGAPLIADLRPLLTAEPVPLAVATATVLAFHDAAGVNESLVRQFLVHEDPEVRAGGWRLAGYLGHRADARAWSAALEDDPVIRILALEAHAWSADPEVLQVGRRVDVKTAAKDWLDELGLLAILGEPADLPRITAIGSAPDLGPDRFRIIGAFGHPALMDLVLPALRDPDPATAVAAGAAFTKITGVDIESTTVATIVPAGTSPDEFDAEFLDQAAIPDPSVAQRHWQKVGPSLAQATRVCHGLDVSESTGPVDFQELDMQSRWEAYLRARYRGGWTGSALHLERLLSCKQTGAASRTQSR
jgi:uncharacterized protein (TIGR02270 family)